MAIPIYGSPDVDALVIISSGQSNFATFFFFFSLPMRSIPPLVATSGPYILVHKTSIILNVDIII